MGSNRKSKGNRGSHQHGAPVGTPASASISSASSASGNTNLHQKNKRNNRSLPMPTVLQPTHSVGSASTQQADPTSVSSIWMAEVLEEQNQEPTAFRITCKEIMTFGLVLLAMFGISMLVGIAAGLSVSVHIHDTVDYSSAKRIITQQRVTISEPSIVQTVLNMDGTVDIDPPAPYGEWTDQMISEGPEATNPASDDSKRRHPDFPLPPRMGSLDDWVRSKPKLCSDGETMGYDTWSSLKSAVEDVNRFSNERYELWHDYFVEVVRAQEAVGADCSMVSEDCPTPHTFEEDWMYYEEEIVMTICPGAVLRKRSRGPIFVNTESMVFECDGCIIQALGTHMAFGPEAKNVLVRGITFKYATSSSLVFYYDGAEASFENCHFVDNRARMKSWGALADVNSTAIVNFYRCSVTKPWGRRHEMSSSLSIRAGP